MSCASSPPSLSNAHLLFPTTDEWLLQLPDPIRKPVRLVFWVCLQLNRVIDDTVLTVWCG